MKHRKQIHSGAVALVTLVTLAVMLNFAGPASANHLSPPTTKFYAFDPPDPNEIPLLLLCFSEKAKKLSSTSYPADTGFFVHGGWFTSPWGEASPADREAFMSSGTTTEFALDGVLQKTSMNGFHEKSFSFAGETFYDVMHKSIWWERHTGLSGTHVLTGEWLLDGVSALRCELTVEFT